MQIFEDDNGRLIQAFAQDDALDRVERAPALGVRIHLGMRVRTLMQSHQGIKQRQGIVERPVKRAQPRLDLAASRGLVVRVLDAEVTVEQLQHRQISRGLAVRHRIGFQHLAVAGQHCLELIHQPRLAGSRLRHRRDDLALACPGQFQRTLHLGHFALAPDELREPAPRCQFEMPTQRSDTRHLVDIDRLAHALDFSLPEVAQFEVALDQTTCFLADYDATRRRHGLHPRREVGRMTNRGVFGVPARMDHAQDHFARVDADTDFE